MTTRNPARLLAAQHLVHRFRADGHPALIGRRPPTPLELQAAQRSPQGWTIGRDAFAAQLSARLTGPAEPAQVSTSYCGPAAFLYCLLEDRPDLYAAYAIGLWRYAAYRVGSMEVDNDPTTVASMGTIQRAHAAAPQNESISELDWMTMASLSVSTRPSLVLGGGATPNDMAKAISYPWVVKNWFAAVGSTPTFDCMSMGVMKKPLSDFVALMNYWPQHFIVLQIDSSLITGGNTATFNNRHWVVVNPHRPPHAYDPNGTVYPLGSIASQFRVRRGIRGGSTLDWSHMANWRTDLTLVTWGNEAHAIRAPTLNDIEDRFYGGYAFPRLK